MFEQKLKNTESLDEIHELLSNYSIDREISLNKINEDDIMYANLQISILNTGFEKSPECPNDLFIDFSKLQEKSTGGLGMSICKKIIE